MNENNIITLSTSVEKYRQYFQDVPVSIPEEEINKWKQYLIRDTNNTINGIKDSDLAFKGSITSFEDYKTVHFDSERTRVLQTKSYPSFKSDLKDILIYYCINTGISYKQGLNEILAPFLILHCHYPHLVTKAESYLMFKEFVDIYIRHFILEKQFNSFRESLQFFQMLLRYHNPILYSFFEKISVIPEMYALSWLITVFSSKVSLDIVYSIWGYYLIPMKDPLFPYYLLLALYLDQTDRFIKEDSIKVISMLCSITIESNDQLKALVNRAILLREETPYSFKLMIDSIGMFDYKKSSSDYNRHSIGNNGNGIGMGLDIEKIPLMPMLAYELCHLTRPDVFKCPNSNCPHIGKYSKTHTNSINKTKSNDDFYCWICDNNTTSDSKSELYDSYIILDIRDSRQLDCCGLITKSIFIKDEFLNDKSKETVIPQMFKNEKGKYKFIILLSKTSYISAYEKESTVTMTGRCSIEVNSKAKHSHTRLNPLFQSAPSNKMKEYKKFKKLISLLINKNEFPYVSYCYGGFEEVHKLYLQHNIPIVLHTYSECLLCNKSRNNIKGKRGREMRKTFHEPNSNKNRHNYSVDIALRRKTTTNKTITSSNRNNGHMNKNDKEKETMMRTVTMNEISDIISSNKSQVYFGILIKYKEDKKISNAQLFICLNEKECNVYIKETDMDNCDSFSLLDCILINQIAVAKRDVNTKNILLLSVMKESSLSNDLLIDFTNKEECRRFLVDLKEYGSLIKTNH